MQKAKSPSTLQSRVFEVAFGPGSIGLHLQRPKGNIGAYVDSFYRTGNLPGIAERLGRINIGDLIVSVNGEDVSRLQFDAIPKRIEKAKRPVVIGFERPHAEFSFVEVASDPRKVPFYLQYIMTRADSQVEQAKLMLWLEVDQYRDQSINIPGDDHTPQATRIFEKFFNPRSTFTMTEVLPRDMQERVERVYDMILEAEGTNTQPGLRQKFRELYTEAMEWVESEISAHTYADFKRSPFYCKMVAYLRWAAPFVKVTLTEVLQTPRAQPYLQMYLAHQKRDNPLFTWLRISSHEESLAKLEVLLAEEPVEHEGDAANTLTACAQEVIACALAIIDIYSATYSSLSDLECVGSLTHLLQRPGLRATRSELIGLNGVSSAEAAVAERPPNGAKAFQQLLVQWSNIAASTALAVHADAMLNDSAALRELCRLLRCTKTMAMRELSIELYPKFLGSDPYEAMLQELDDVRRQDAERFTRSFGHILSVIPEGAVLRMLRQLQTPSHLSVHRKVKERVAAEDPGRRSPACWLIRFDTLAIDRGADVEPELTLSIDSVFEVPQTEGLPRLLDDPSGVPAAVTAFLVPNNTLRYTYSCPPDQPNRPLPAKLFNFALMTREHLRLYGSCLLLHKPLSTAASPRLQDVSSRVANLAAETVGVGPFTPPAAAASNEDGTGSEPSERSEESSPRSAGFRAATKQILSQWQSSVKVSLNDLGSAVKEFQDTLHKHSRSPRARRGSDVLSRQSSASTATSEREQQPAQSPLSSNAPPESLGPDASLLSSLPHAVSLRERSLSADLLRRSISLELGDATATTDVVPHGYCVLSTEPLLDTLRTPLVRAMGSEASEDSTKEDTSLLLGDEATWAAIREQYGKNEPHSVELPACDFNPHIVLRSLNPRNFTILFVAALLECKIVLKSSRLTALTVMGEFLRCLLLPLQWSHVYVPLLPKMMSTQLMQCPTPFIIGIPREYCHNESLPEDACVVDLDNDEVRVPPHLQQACHAGRRLARAIDAVCRPELHHCDSLSSHASSFDGHGRGAGPQNEHLEILKLCKQFTADLLTGLKECCYVCSDKGEEIVMLNERMFEDYRKNRRRTSMFGYDSSFISHFLRTQLLSHYISENI